MRLVDAVGVGLHPLDGGVRVLRDRGRLDLRRRRPGEQVLVGADALGGVELMGGLPTAVETASVAADADPVTATAATYMSGAGPDYDVAIVGCGPVGAIAANLLGHAGLRTMVIEREVEPYPLPALCTSTTR